MSLELASIKPQKLEQTWFETEIVLPTGEKVVHRYGAWPKQVQFHTAQARYVTYGGARGPGKTRALAEHILAVMLKWPGIPVLVCRRDLKDLKLTFLREWLQVCPKELYDPKYGGQWHKGENWFRFPNMSFLQMGELKDWESYKSGTFGLIAIDELNEVDEEAHINLDPTLRWTTGEGVCKRPECLELGEEWAREHNEHPFYQIIAATNPSPGWVKTVFWEPWKHGREKPNHRFISATAFDNPSLPPDFIPRLLERNTATWVQNYIYGDWSSFENMVWPTANRAIHGWKGPIPLNEFRAIYGGIDYGGTTQEAHRTCAYLVGVTKSGQKITFWEYSKQGGAAKDFFATIAAVNKQYKNPIWGADASQHRANELLRERGIAVVDAPRYQGAVKDGINLIHRWLQPDATGRPEIYISEELCPRLWSGIETYQLDPDTGLPAKNQEDDEVNAWRYAAMQVDRGRVAGGNRDFRVVNGAASGQKRDTSRIMQRMKSERRERLRAWLANNPDA